MSLDFSGLVQDMCTEFGESAVFISVVSVYDQTTSETEETRTSTSVNAVFYSDRKALALLARLAARGSVDTVEGTSANLAAVLSPAQLVGVTPKVNDVLQRANGDEWTIESVSVDPTNSAYVFGLRRP